MYSQLVEPYTSDKYSLDQHISTIYSELNYDLLYSFGCYGRAHGSFDAPKAVAIDINNTNRIFIADALNSRVQVFSPSPVAEYQYEIRTIRSFQEGCIYFWGLCIHGELIYVTETKVGAISVFTLDGELITRYKPQNSLLYSIILSAPRGLLIDGNNDLFVCDSQLGFIRILSSDYPFYRVMGATVLNRPVDLKKYRDKLIVLDTSTIFEFSSTELLIRHVFKLLVTPNSFRCEFIAIDSLGNILISDTQGKILVVSSRNNNNHNNSTTSDDDKDCTIYQLSMKFVNPKGLAFDSEQKLVTVSEGSARLNIYEINFPTF